MPRFQVITERLQTASFLVRTGGAFGGGGGMSAPHGALAGTPAAGAYESLVRSVDSAVASLGHVSNELSGALADAALAYEISDQSAAGSLAVKSG